VSIAWKVKDFNVSGLLVVVWVWDTQTTTPTELRTYMTLLNTNYIISPLHYSITPLHYITAMHIIGGNNTHIVSSS